MIEAVLLTMTQNWSLSSEIANKKELLNDQHIYLILCSGLELKKCPTDVSKHLGILLNVWRGDNNAMVSVKTASSTAIIVCLVGVSVNYDSFYVQCDACVCICVVCICVCIHVVWWFFGGPFYWFIFIKWLFSTSSGKPTARDIK